MAAPNDLRQPPAFIITVDTEGDNMWAKPRDILTRNVDYLPRFQSLCERFGLKPVYLTDWEMAADPAYREFAADVIARGQGEIGMHLHAWNTPPIVPLTSDDYQYHPYLIEYPTDTLREKVHVMTSTLEDYFQVKMISHRAGRFGFNSTYAEVLRDEGYRVDCSVTPHLSWKVLGGDPGQDGGPDYTSCPESAYWLDIGDITRPGNSPLLEVPVSIRRNPHRPRLLESRQLLALPVPLVDRLSRRVFPEWVWLRPFGHNRRGMLSILAAAQSGSHDFVEFMIHSSELMPGGSPMFPTEESIAKLYDDLEILFQAGQRGFDPMTLGQYLDHYLRQHLQSTVTTATVPEGSDT